MCILKQRETTAGFEGAEETRSDFREAAQTRVEDGLDVGNTGDVSWNNPEAIWGPVD